MTVAGCRRRGLSFWVGARRYAAPMDVVVMQARTRGSPNVSVSVSLRRVGRRLSKAVSAPFGAHLGAGCRATAATGTCGGCCRASCRSDSVATVAQAVREEKRTKGSLCREKDILLRLVMGVQPQVFGDCEEAQGCGLVRRNALQPMPPSAAAEICNFLSALQGWRRGGHLITVGRSRRRRDGRRWVWWW